MTTLTRGLNAAKAIFAYATESTAGAAAGGTYYDFGNVRNETSPDMLNEVIQSYGMGHGREPTDLAQGRLTPTEGTVTFGYQNMRWMNMLGQVADTSPSTPKVHTWTDTLAAPTFTVKENYVVAGSSNDWIKTWAGCIATKAIMRLNLDNNLEVDLSFVPGAGGTLPVLTTNADASVTTETTDEYSWSHHGGGTLTIVGVADQPITDWTISVNVNFNHLWKMDINEQHYVDDVVPGRISYEVSGTINVMDSGLFELIDNDPQAAATTTIKLEQVNSPQNDLVFTLSNSFLTAHPWSTPEEGAVTATFTSIAKSMTVVETDTVTTYAMSGS